MTQEQHSKSDLWHEAKLLGNIAFPTVVIQFCIYFIYPQTASAVGRNLQSEDLAGFSLGSLTGNMTCLAMIMGVLSAVDTLMPRAYGAKNYSQVGILAVRCFVVCALLLLVPVLLLTTSMDWIFTTLGQDPIAAELATEWLRIYIMGVPFVLLFRILQRFLACQHIVWPMVYGSFVGCALVHPFLLEVLIPYVGFLGSGVSIVVTQFFQALFVLIYLRYRPVHNPETWVGLSTQTWRQALELGPMFTFLNLSLGGVLSLTEWFFWEVVCMLAGHMGVVPLCVHTVAYNLVPVCFMIPLGISVGLSIRMGHVLAEDVSKAKVLATVSMGVTVLLACVVAVILWSLQDPLVSLFTRDEEVKAGCSEIWHFVCIHIFLLYILGINGGIMRALGMQWAMAGIICATLWLVALPTLAYFAVYKGGGVQKIWQILPVFYCLMNGALVLSYATADWCAISQSIRRRRSNSVASEEISDATEATKLLGGEMS